MNIKSRNKILFAGAFIFAISAMCARVMADDAVDFVDEASAKGIAEIEAGKLALQKSTSPDVKEFAQVVIDDHTAANKELAQIAAAKNLKVATETELTNKAKAYILKHRDGDNFDLAYAKNQVSAHEGAIKLFEKAASLKDPELSTFAKATLPKLKHHLELAHKLVATTTSTKLENNAKR